jgi:poly(A) polymerase
LGYFGGISWAILVARVCIIFPYLKPNKLLSKFFEYYLNYDWAYNNPILITDLKNDPERLSFKIEKDLFYQPNTSDLMPIITPAFPAQNSTYNVSESTKRAIMTELEKGHLIVQ